MGVDKSNWPRGVDMPSKEQRVQTARRLAEREDATKAELEEAADAIGARPAAKGRTTKADLKAAIAEAADPTNEEA